MQLVMVAGVRVVVDPGVHLARVHDHCALSFMQSNFPRVDDVNSHPYFSYSALMLAAWMTLAHFSVSSAISFPNSGGEVARAWLPRSASRALIVGSARPALIALLSMSTTSAGVFFGATRPCQELASYPGRKSLMIGTSGSASEREAPVTAKARREPARMYAIDDAGPGNITCTCPPSRSVRAGPPPR